MGVTNESLTTLGNNQRESGWESGQPTDEYSIKWFVYSNKVGKQTPNQTFRKYSFKLGKHFKSNRTEEWEQRFRAQPHATWGHGLRQEKKRYTRLPRGVNNSA